MFTLTMITPEGKNIFQRILVFLFQQKMEFEQSCKSYGYRCTGRNRKVKVIKDNQQILLLFLKEFFTSKTMRPNYLFVRLNFLKKLTEFVLNEQKNGEEMQES